MNNDLLVVVEGLHKGELPFLSRVIFNEEQAKTIETSFLTILLKLYSLILDHGINRDSAKSKELQDVMLDLRTQVEWVL